MAAVSVVVSDEMSSPEDTPDTAVQQQEGLKKSNNAKGVKEDTTVQQREGS